MPIEISGHEIGQYYCWRLRESALPKAIAQKGMLTNTSNQLAKTKLFHLETVFNYYIILDWTRPS